MSATAGLRTLAKPFLKWAGGKGQLLDTFANYYPQKLSEGVIEKYVEPFLGGGAVLFDVMQKFNIEKAYVYDVNKELINTYLVIKNNINELIELLKKIESKFIALDTKVRKEMYYIVREEFNKGEGNPLEMAAWFIFLNRTCFNGLHRVNKKGLFNVPSGDYKNPTICDEDNLRVVSTMLQRVEIICGDYKDSENICDANTFMYFDPPYRPLNLTSSFTSYSRNVFNDVEQISLGNYYRECHEKGAMVMLSNSDPKNVNVEDHFFDNIYKDFNIFRVRAKRCINSNASGRGFINEILITNYEK